MLKKGKVIYSSGGNYKVSTDCGIFNAKPLGIFRNSKTKILVGDNVSLKINNGDELNVITELEKRKNVFVRPNISNVDFAILATSISEPKLNDYYLDKLITIFQIKNVEPILLFTKSDLSFTDKEKQIIEEYIKANYKVLISNNGLNNRDIQNLEKWTKNKLTVITGQTGVGKSTFINKLTNLNIKTNEISKALGRGKHTTRHSEIYELFKDSFIIDTPGFSSLEIEKEDFKLLPHHFFNFKTLFNDCKFNDCKHINEINCNVISNSSKRTLNNYWKLIKEGK